MKKKIICTILATLLAVSFSACGGTADTSTNSSPSSQAETSQTSPTAGAPAQSTGTLRLGMLADPDTLNPLSSIDGNAGFWFSKLSYPTLLTTDMDAEAAPNVAKDYDVSDDGLTVTYHLREGLKWSDGTPFTSQDVAYTKYLAGDLQLSNTLTAPLQVVESVDTPDDYTVVFNLNTPTYTFAKAIGLRLCIVPKHIWEKIDDPKNFLNEEDPVCMGPYKMKEFKRGEYYIFENIQPEWFSAPSGGAAMKELVFRVYPDVNAMALALQSGEIDITAKDVPYDIAGQLTAEGFTQVQNVSLGFTHIGFQLENELLSDVNLRHAIAQAVNKQTVLQFAVREQGDLMDSIIAPVYSAYQSSDPAAKYPAYDAEAAKAALADAGYTDTDGDGILNAPGGANVAFNMIIIANDNALANGAEVIAQNLKEIGIALEVVPLERTTYIQRRLERDFDSYLGNWGFMEAPLGDFVTNYDASSPVYFHAVEMPGTAAAVEHMRTAYSEEDLVDSIHEFEIAMASDCMAIPLYAPRYSYVYNPHTISNVTAYHSMVYGVSSVNGLLAITPAESE